MKTNIRGAYGVDNKLLGLQLLSIFVNAEMLMGTVWWE